MAVQKVYLLNQATPTIVTGGLVPKGTYNASTDYNVGDSVDYNGSSYVMFANAGPGTLPTNTSYWQVIASKGAAGDVGPAGPDGPAGGVNSVNTRQGDVVLAKSDVGLGNVDNTSDINKPLSSQQKLYIDSLVLTGVGFPNGAISASPGAIYADTAITNGASLWVKKSGTGNTGWSVLEGDTGWRNVGSLLLNGWVANQARLRRINNQIYWGFEALNSGSMTAIQFISVPTGFQFVGATYSDRQFLTTAANPAVVWRATIGHLGTNIELQGAATGTALLYGVLNSTTTQSWPSTLPGSAL